ncbi:MAG: M15 family metallopeptidase [Actinomycetota bacterium]
MKRIALLVPFLVLAAACEDDRTLRPAARPSVEASTTPATDSPSRSAAPRFTSAVAHIDAATRARMSASWRLGCPVPLEDLRLVRLRHWGFDDAHHIGEIVVHEDVAEDVVRVFRDLFSARFPIHRMRLVDEYGADDARSMAANNTSAFNCRRSAGDPSAWSEHAYGRAIDINPVHNPYVTSSGGVEPAAGEPFADRSRARRGMILSGGPVVRAFRGIGWGWGGTWERSKDFQHFSQSGR